MPNQSELTPRAQRMYSIIKKYLASGLTQKVFCKQEGLALSTFQLWLSKYRTHSHANKNCSRTHNFIPVHLNPPHPAAEAGHCVIEYPNGVIVRLSGKTEVALVSQLVQVTTGR